MAKVALLSVSVLFFAICSFGDDTFFEEVPLALRCSGCEMTVKVADGLMTRSSIRDVKERVDKVLDHICHEDRFKSSEFKIQTMSRVCEFMQEKHGVDLRRELIEHYTHPARSTYLEFSQHICIGVMRMCPGTGHRNTHYDKEGDTQLHFDSKSHEFTVVPGKNLRMPEPVHELHMELDRHDEL